MKTINYLVTTTNLVLNFDNKTFVISTLNEKEKYDHILDLIRKDNETEIKKYLSPKDSVIKYANHYFMVTDKGRLYMIDKPDENIPYVIASKLMDHINNNIPLEPLVRFWYNLRKNPNQASKDSLYTFLEKFNHPITEEGNFIAYRKVTNNNGVLYDSHTGKMDNSVGKTVSMPRSQCDADVNKPCSTGLHVASLDYARGFTGDTLIVVVVNPEHVVAVPKGEDSKMRVCEFKVIGLYDDPKMEQQISGYDGKAILSKLPNDSKFTGKTPVIEAHKSNQHKSISLKGKSAKEIIEIIGLTFNEKITLSVKNKDGILKKAVAIAEKRGYKIMY